MGNNVKYRSGNFDLAIPVGLMTEDTPLMPDLNLRLIFRQKLWQSATTYETPPYNDPLYGFPNFVNGVPNATAFCCGDGPRRDVNGNIFEFERSFALVPPAYERSGGIYQYTFPGLSSATRDPWPWPSRVTVQRTFFLCGNNGVFTQWQDIPIQKSFQPYLDNIYQFVNLLDDTTTPTEADYLAAVTSNVPLGLEGTRVNSQGVVELLIEDSKICQWFGSIYVRDELWAPAL